MIGLAFTLAGPIQSAWAQETFYKGKTIRLIVGLAPGGGFDAYSRVIARHIGKHIPGNPTTVVDNMPGAASLLAANYVYKAARPDGLTIGNFIGGLSFQQMLGLPGVEFDAPKFEFLGVPAQDNFMIGVAKSTGITSVEQWRASGTVIKIGGVAPGGGTDDIPKVLKATLGLPLQLVSGYKGTGPVRLAFNAGEVGRVLVDRCPSEEIDIADATKVRLAGNRVLAIGKGMEAWDAIDVGCFVLTPAIFEALRHVSADEPLTAAA